MDICINKLAIIVLDNGLSPGRCQAIIWTNAGIWLMQTLETNFSEILNEIHTFSFKKMRLKMSSAKWIVACLTPSCYLDQWWLTDNCSPQEQTSGKFELKYALVSMCRMYCIDTLFSSRIYRCKAYLFTIILLFVPISIMVVLEVSAACWCMFFISELYFLGMDNSLSQDWCQIHYRNNLDYIIKVSAGIYAVEYHRKFDMRSFMKCCP